MVTKKAIIEWIPKDEGGRTHPPLGEGVAPYMPEIRFVDDDRWPDSEGWSLVVAKDSSRSTDLRWIADVHFRVQGAPHDSLREGREFELYEGNRRVAHGWVLGDKELDAQGMAATAPARSSSRR